jgi:hypothetical protein
MERFEDRATQVRQSLGGVDSGLGNGSVFRRRRVCIGELLSELQSGPYEGDLAFQCQLSVLESTLLDREGPLCSLDHREHQGLGLQEIRELLLDGEGVAHGGVVVEAVGGLHESNELQALDGIFTEFSLEEWYLRGS